MVKCPTCKNFLLQKRASFMHLGSCITRYFCHDCKTEFERSDQDIEIEPEKTFKPIETKAGVVIGQTGKIEPD